MQQRTILILLFFKLLLDQSHGKDLTFSPPFELKLSPTKSGLDANALSLVQSTVEYYLRIGFDDLLEGNKNSVTDLVVDLEEYYWYRGSKFSHTDMDNRTLMVENVTSDPCDSCPDYSILKFSGNVEFRSSNQFSDEASMDTVIEILDGELTKKHMLQALQASPHETLWGVTDMDFAKKFIQNSSYDNEDFSQSKNSSSNGWVIILASACVVVFSIFMFVSIYRYCRQRQWDFVNEMGKEDIEIARNVQKLRKEKQGAFVFNSYTLSFDRLKNRDDLVVEAAETGEMSLSSSSHGSPRSVPSPSIQSGSMDIDTSEYVSRNILNEKNDNKFNSPPKLKPGYAVEQLSPVAAAPNSSRNLENDVKDILLDLEHQEKEMSPQPSPVSAIKSENNQKNHRGSSISSNNESSDLLGLSEHQQNGNQTQRSLAPAASLTLPSAPTVVIDTIPTIYIAGTNSPQALNTSINSNYEFGQSSTISQWETMAEDDKVFHFGKGKRVTFADALPEI